MSGVKLGDESNARKCHVFEMEKSERRYTETYMLADEILAREKRWKIWE